MTPIRHQTLATALALLIAGPTATAGNSEVDEEPGANSTLDDDRTGTLLVQIRELESSEGTLRFVLFNSKKDFLKRPVRAEVIDIDDRQGTWTVEDLPFGEYAVLVHHDVDASGVMERHWYGKPKEPTGASNDAPSRFGPPRYKHAKFRLESPTLTIEIAVR